MIRPVPVHHCTEPRSFRGPQSDRQGLNRSVMRTSILADDLSQTRGEALGMRSFDDGIHVDGQT